jgi:cardiolipin synthase A/B
VPSLPAILFWLGWTVRLVMLPVVIRRKSQPAVCLAWLTIIFLVPFVGLAAYLLIGEIRLGSRRIRRHARDVDVVAKADRRDIQLRHIVEPEIEKTQQVLLHVADQLGGLPVLGGNWAELLAETNPVIDRLVQDIDQAQHHVHLLFYIFAADEVGERVGAALGRARARGVHCRLLADAVGSHKFFRALAPKLTRQGIEVVPALPVNPVRRLFARLDLRNHRKLAVIDGRLAYTGSQNVVRADYGKKGVGEWRDLMVRLVGPSVSQLQAVFLEDWEFETGQFIDDPEYFPPSGVHGPVALQVAPSGPNHPTRVLRDLAVEALHAAHRRVVIITPYFVPDEALLVALRLAVVRGVRVDLIVPARNDQLWVGLAGQFFFDEVLQQGVHVHLYQLGLIHVKAMTVDEGFAMLGTANFDIRSFYLNFELNLLSYDADLNGLLRFYQTTCIQESNELDLSTWRSRSHLQRWGAQFAKLLSPLL